MFCNQCGAQQQFEESRFCNSCGSSLSPNEVAAKPIATTPTSSRKYTFLGWIIITGVGGMLVIAAIIGAAVMQSSQHPQNSLSGNASISPTPYVEPTPSENDLQIVKSSWQKGGFGSIAIWKITFKNNSAKPIGNIHYSTEYHSETGERVDSGGESSLLGGHVIQKVIPPKSTRTLEVNDGFTHSQAHRANFTLVSSEFVADKR